MPVFDRAYLHPCVAHRGWSGKAPENTMAAFRLALAEPAVEWMELDVQLSRDEVPVVIHDETLQRTTNGKGRVRDWTARELSRLDAGSWFHPDFAGETVPTLEQVLELARGRCRLNIELKTEGTERAYGERLARHVTDMLKSMRLERDVVITSFDPRCLRAVRRFAPDIRTGLIAFKRKPDLVRFLRALGASFLSIAFRRLHPALLDECAQHEVDVMVWTVNRPGDIARLTAMPDSFLLCTNHPDRWLAAVREQVEA
jgi:glycerophosphoryl diester phosphodiesterase